MKPIKILTSLAFVFLIVSIAVSNVYAQTTVSTYDHGDKAQTTADGKSVFACDATISIETEPQGGWLPNKTYQVNWTLRLDYVNSQVLNGSNFYIQFSWPPLENVTPTIPADAVLNQTRLSLAHKVGVISGAFTPTNTSDGFFMNPEFPFAVYVNGEVLTDDWASGIWYGDGATSTNLIGNDATPQPTMPLLTTDSEFPTLTVTAIVAIAALLAVSALVIVRKRKAIRS
jgi:hypothetical protein